MSKLVNDLIMDTDIVALSSDVPAFAVPSGYVGLSFVEGVATTVPRTDASFALDQGIVPTWTGVHTFSSEPVFNGGIDLGASGVVDSQVLDAAGVVLYKLKPTTVLTSGQDRAYFQVQSTGGAGYLTVNADGSVVIGGIAATAGQISFSGTPSANASAIGDFRASAGNFSSAGANFLGLGNAIVGGIFVGRGSSSSSAIRHYGGIFAASDTCPNTTPYTALYAGYFRAFRNNATTGTHTHAEGGGLYIDGINGGAVGPATFTAWNQIRVRKARLTSTKPVMTTATLMYFDEETSGTNNRGILLEQSTSGYKAICFRDSAAWINSDAANDLDLNAVTSIDFNINATEELGLTTGLLTCKDGFNFAYGTGTGSQHATATNQKQAWWGATPITQPANTVAINDVLVNTGFRATGGDSNFSTHIVLDSGAKVKKEYRIEASMARKGASAPSESLRAVGASGTCYSPVLAFSKTVQNDIYFTFHAPTDIDTGVAATFHLMWQPGAAWTTGNYVWKLEYLVMNESGATLLAGTPTTISADVTPSNATTNIETEFTGNITIAADQVMVCHFYRDVASDSADDVGEVSFVEFEYTSNKLGEAV